MQSLINTQKFLALSSFLNYQLSGVPINWRGILTLMVGEKLQLVSEDLLVDTLCYLDEAYGQQKRRLGPLAILHPIRAASLLSMAEEFPTTLDLLTTLLHDRDEDIIEDGYSPAAWQHLESTYEQLLGDIGSNAGLSLKERIHYLTRKKGITYHEYLGQLIKKSAEMPELIRVKLADRLDNTLDLRIDLHDETSGSGCYRVIFDALFVNTYKGLKTKQPHPIARKINGAMRLYQLYKNAGFLSLIRSAKIDLDKPSQRLFEALATAGISEAQNIMLHIFSYHLTDPMEQKKLLQEVMTYAQEGGLQYVNVGERRRLDGLFKKHFEYRNKNTGKKNLDILYEDKQLMGQAAVAFIAIFASFINDPEFTIRGISADGITPQANPKS